MAHEIDMTTGVAAVFTVGEPPWHGLGANITEAQTSRQAVTLAHLDWNVELWPLRASDPKGSLPEVACHLHRATLRTDTRAVLGVVGDGYTPFQNHEAFAFMDTLVGEKLAMFESAGALRGGRVVWMLARIPKQLWVTPDDEVRPYLLLTNSHDGSMAVRMLPTCVRVVCMNTLNLALRQGQGSGWSIRHCPSLPERVEEARRALGMITQRLDRFAVETKLLRDKQVNSRQLSSYFDMLLPAAQTDRTRTHRDGIVQRFYTNFANPTNTLPGVRGSMWAAYNAVSEWADHQKTYRGSLPATRRERRLDSIWFGASNEFKQDAWAAAMEMAASN